MNVGIDHGYYAIKTRHFSFLAGIAVYSHEPYTLQNTLEYGVPNASTCRSLELGMIRCIDETKEQVRRDVCYRCSGGTCADRKALQHPPIPFLMEYSKNLYKRKLLLLTGYSTRLKTLNILPP